MTPSPAPHTPDAQIPGESTPARPPACPSQRAYPWLLLLSTAVAALFCGLYITKPVIVTSSAPHPAAAQPGVSSRPAPPTLPTDSTAASATTGLLPPTDRLPGDPRPSGNPSTAGAPTLHPPTPKGSPSSVFEETNLRVQHVLTAETPGGPLARIDLDVPVLYQSRSLRWTPADVAEARSLLVRLMDYQEKSQRLRTDGSELLDAWNRLINRSLPTEDLRADSPSLPANQQDSADMPRPANLNTNESIQIQPAAK